MRADGGITRADGGFFPTIVTDGAKALVFDAGELKFRPSGLNEGGFAYFSTIKDGSTTSPKLLLARVPQHQVTQRSAFRFWNGSAYVANINDAVQVQTQSLVGGQGTISYNAYLNQYVMITQYSSTPGLPISMNGKMLTANRPEGPWSDALSITGKESLGVYQNYFFMEHPVLQRNGGKTIVISYSNMPVTGGQNLQMAEITFQ